MKAQIQDDIEFQGSNGLDVGQDQKEESHSRVPHTDNALDKNGYVMHTLANLLAEREKKKEKNASLTFYIMYGMKLLLLKFLKPTPPTFKRIDNLEDP